MTTDNLLFRVNLVNAEVNVDAFVNEVMENMCARWPVLTWQWERETDTTILLLIFFSEEIDVKL